MVKENSSIENITIENLLINSQNPRYEPTTNQRNAIITIAKEQGQKLYNLAEDVVNKGLNPSELPLVTPNNNDKNTFIVLEGNRRIVALKLLSSSHLLTTIGLPANLLKKFQELSIEAKDTIPRNIPCAVVSREDAAHWIYLKHTGENEGVGVVNWDGVATHRFRGSSPALQAIDRVESSDYLDEATKRKLPKIAITNIERILGTPEARSLLGVDVINGELIFKSKEEEDKAIARLSLIVSDIAHGHKKVTDLLNKTQRVEYAKEIASRPSPQKRTETDKTTTKTTSATSAHVRQAHAERKSLIPKSFKLSISHIRINKIFQELQSIDVDKYLNCCAVMLRVFIELSLEDFAQRKNISLTTTKQTRDKRQTTIEMNLRTKLKTVIGYLEKNSICTKNQLKGINVVANREDQVVSVDCLHAYLHNKDYHPSPRDLRVCWDNIQIFIEHLWK